MSSAQSNLAAGRAPGSPYKLVIGTKAWSSWSLRPWVAMRHFDIPFDEVEIQLRSPATTAEIARYSPSGKIPALIDGTLTVWDSLAILEYLAERHPDKAFWPADPTARAVARTVSAEMHSGFVALRQNCPMDFLARGLTPADTGAIAADVRRIVAIWQDCRDRFAAGGPCLFGAFSAADAMYAPVASRFATYGIDLQAYGGTGAAQRYAEVMMANPAMAKWAAGIGKSGPAGRG
jgi:glutathione S-transferase